MRRLRRRACGPRVAALEEPLRRLVEIAAVAGGPVPRAIAAAAAAGLSPDRLRDALTTMRAVRLLRAHCSRGERLDTYHDRVRADALVGAGRCHDAALEYIGACADVSPETQLTLHGRAIAEHLRGGYIDDGLDLLHAVLRKLGVRVRLEGWLALLPLLWARLRLRWRGFEYPSRSAEATREAKPHMLDLWWSLAAGFSLTTSIRAGYFHTRTLLGRARRLPRGARGVRGRALRVAVELVDRGDARLRGRCTGVSWELSASQIVGLAALAKLGDFREVRRRFLRLRREARAQGNLFAETNLRTRVAPMLALLDDAPEVARRDVLDARRLPQQQERAHEGGPLGLATPVRGRSVTGVEVDLHQRAARVVRLEEICALRPAADGVEALDLRGRAALAHAASAPEHCRALLRRAARCASRLEGPQWSPPGGWIWCCCCGMRSMAPPRRPT